jgi:hypothetical protein
MNKIVKAKLCSGSSSSLHWHMGLVRERASNNKKIYINLIYSIFRSIRMFLIKKSLIFFTFIFIATVAQNKTLSCLLPFFRWDLEIKRNKIIERNNFNNSFYEDEHMQT